MSRSAEAKADACRKAIESASDYRQDQGDFVITFDGKFSYQDVILVLEIGSNISHSYTMERGTKHSHAYFENEDAAFNCLFWKIVRPDPKYSSIYAEFGPGIDMLKDLVDQELAAFDFACRHFGISPDRYYINNGQKPTPRHQDAWICSKSGKGWQITHERNGIPDLVGEFEHVSHALEFMFWTLSGAETYKQRHARSVATG
jgi:hypothetical protein